jgi:hypothetical protein
MLWGGAEVLDGPTCRFAKGAGRVERPVWIAEHLAGEEDEIGLTLGNDGVGLMWIRDHADCCSGDSSLSPDACSERHLVPGADRDGDMGYEAPGRAINQVDAMGAELAGEGDGIVNGPS